MARPILNYYSPKLLNAADQLRQATPESAGYDLKSDDDIIIWPFQCKLVPTALHLALPANSAGLVLSRSGLGTKKRLTVAQGVGLIDPDYRGLVYVPLANHGLLPRRVKRGERIAQLLILPAVHPLFHLVPRLSDLTVTDRLGGFGHTGVA